MACATATIAFLCPPVPDPAIACGEGAGGGADAGGEGGLDRGGAEPAVAMASPAGAMLARALMVAGAEAGPAGGVLGGGEDAHVRPEFGDEDLGGALVHAADRVQTPEQLGEGRHGAIDLGAHGLDGLVQVVDMGGVG